MPQYLRRSRIEWGVERCYAVRAVDVIDGAERRERREPGALRHAAPTPFRPRRPPASTGPSEGAISLIWDAGKETDVAGYIVLRGDRRRGKPDAAHADADPGDRRSPTRCRPARVTHTPFRRSTRRATSARRRRANEETAR